MLLSRSAGLQAPEERTGDHRSDFSHEDVKRLKLVASKPPARRAPRKGRRAGRAAFAYSTHTHRPAQQAARVSASPLSPVEWDRMGRAPQPGSPQSVDVVASETSKPRKTKAAFSSAPGITGPGMGHLAPDQHPAGQRLPAAPHRGARLEGAGEAQTPLERPPHSFTLPGAASCKRRVSCSGGIFTGISPKCGFH